MNTPITDIICKKSFRSGGQNIYVDFIKGTQYSKFILETQDMSLDYYIPFTYKYIYIYDEHGGIRFHLNKNLEGWGCEDPTFPNFYDYFYDQREIRKLKLEKIKQFE